MRAGPGAFAPDYVRTLFQEMAATYGVVNLVASLGFSHRWRQACVARLAARPGWTVYDLMSGMGECWPLLARGLRGSGRIVGVDFCPAMCARADRVRGRLGAVPIELRCEDLLTTALPPASADGVVSSFGLKTFATADRARVAAAIARLLRPGGEFSLVEIAVPRAWLLRLPYLFYLSVVIPVIGLLFLGNPWCYRMLGVYTRAFGAGEGWEATLRAAGLEVRVERLFFGCATAFVGRRLKPETQGAAAPRAGGSR